MSSRPTLSILDPVSAMKKYTKTVHSSGPEVEADNAEEDVVNSTGNVINSVENVSPTPYLKITDVKSDCWKVSAGGGAADGAYKMDKRPHGVALIVSNTVFEDGTNLTNRDGGEKDEPALQTLFETLGYKVLLLTNLSGAQIKKALQIVTGHENMSFAKLRNPKDKKNLEKLNAEDCLVSGDHDSFVLCLMTHGEEGVVLGTDNEEFKINEIYNIAGKCENLTNKPKMVFIQACRGDDIPQADGDSVTKKPRDFFFSFATFHGHAAFRGQDGTWYVKALCEIFENGHKTKDLLSMITEVHCEVNNKRYEDQDGTVLSQTPQKSDTLRYKVYFDMKEPCVLSTS